MVLRQLSLFGGGKTKYSDPNLPMKVDSNGDPFPDGSAEAECFLRQVAASEYAEVGGE